MKVRNLFNCSVVLLSLRYASCAIKLNKTKQNKTKKKKKKPNPPKKQEKNQTTKH